MEMLFVHQKCYTCPVASTYIPGYTAILIPTHFPFLFFSLHMCSFAQALEYDNPKPAQKKKNKNPLSLYQRQHYENLPFHKKHCGFSAFLVG